MNIPEMGQKARAAARTLAKTSTDQRNAAILSISRQLSSAPDSILAANTVDLEQAEQAGLSAAMLDRLKLNAERLKSIAEDTGSVATLPDPVGERFEAKTLSNGLQIRKQRVPLGVLAVIYEARPNVTVDVACLALKTGNAVILRGGSETVLSNRALVAIITTALREVGLPEDAVQFIDDADRRYVMELMLLQDYVDMLIPRGGAALHKFCREHSRIPVITGGIGICHLFADETADLRASIPLIRNAKVQRPTVCNALDTLLVHRAVAAELLPAVVNDLGKYGVAFRAHESAKSHLIFEGQLPISVQSAEEGDFDTEWLSLVLGLKVVDSLDEAIAHISAHSTGHSDGILTGSEVNAAKFMSEVDSAAVYVNASTRFTDGSQLGMGAEVAISTQRLHARGPMGLKELTTYKWVIQGDYHVRQ